MCMTEASAEYDSTPVLGSGRCLASFSLLTHVAFLLINTPFSGKEIATETAKLTNGK